MQKLSKLNFNGRSIMNNVLISVVVPVFNKERYLYACVESLIRQTYNNIEIILVDDGSSFKCAELCDSLSSLDNRIRVFHKKNGGVSDARNFGIRNSKGEFITQVDPDDFVDNDYIEYLFNLATKYKTKSSICSHTIHFAKGFIKTKGSKTELILNNHDAVEELLYDKFIDTSAWGKLYHRSLFDDVEYPVGKIYEDIGTTYLLFFKCDFIAVGCLSKYHYVYHKESIVNCEFNFKKLDLIEMTDKMGEKVISVYPDLLDAVVRRRVYSRFSTINQMLEIDSMKSIRCDFIDYIKNNFWIVAKNRKASVRDKIALCLIKFNFKLYRFCWIRLFSFVNGS